ncbi:MAG: phytanoyl-CoA dioxygenase family protein [Campylobacterota bacterium]|nr:phytanoyl-CoA dioxygenase family protein [Campylobacterota bacterium]
MKDLYPSRADEERIIERCDPVVHKSQSTSEYALSDEKLEKYEANGFLVIPNAFSSEEIEELNAEFETMAKNPILATKKEFIVEPDSNELRTIFNQHLFSRAYDKLSRDPRILDRVEQILGSDVYIHHSRINIKPAYKGKSFPWHSDFETWHCEDGLPRCRCLTAWVMLTDNTQFNGPLYLIPKSHKKYVSCKGSTPKDNYKNSLKKQEYGVPSVEAIKELMKDSSIASALGRAGTLVFHDGNTMHGSPDNISPTPRSNAFFVFNSVENLPTKPFGAPKPRAKFLALDDYTPLKNKTI